MNDLVILKNDNAVCDSLQVAEKFNKRHDKLVSEIERMYGELVGERCAQNGGHPLFYKTSYKHEQNGQIYKKYLMTRDGFSLLVMGFTGKKALEWKLKYIQAFNQMEQLLREKQTIHWLETRQQSKSNRKLETDEIKKFVEYAKSNGSHNADWYYKSLTNLANGVVGIGSNQRDNISVSQLNNLILIENIIGHVILEGIEKQLYYKEIYKDCKERLEMFKDLAYLELTA